MLQIQTTAFVTSETSYYNYKLQLLPLLIPTTFGKTFQIAAKNLITITSNLE